MRVRKSSFFRIKYTLLFILLVPILITFVTWKMNRNNTASSISDKQLDSLIDYSKNRSPDINAKSSVLTCKSKRKIGFLKIHKAASRYVTKDTIIEIVVTINYPYNSN